MPLHDLTGKICRFSEHFTPGSRRNLGVRPCFVSEWWDFVLIRSRDLSYSPNRGYEREGLNPNSLRVVLLSGIGCVSEGQSTLHDSGNRL